MNPLKRKKIYRRHLIESSNQIINEQEKNISNISEEINNNLKISQENILEAVEESAEQEIKTTVRKRKTV